MCIKNVYTPFSVQTNKLLDNALGGHLDNHLSEYHSRFLKQWLKGLYAFLKDEPELMVRRLQISSRKPEIPKEKQTNFQVRIRTYMFRRFVRIQ